jgi:hypothetical protein
MFGQISRLSGRPHGERCVGYNPNLVTCTYSCVRLNIQLSQFVLELHQKSVLQFLDFVSSNAFIILLLPHSGGRLERVAGTRDRDSDNDPQNMF